MTEHDYVIEVQNISRVYGHNDTRITALRSITIRIRRQEFTAIAGPSGSGKTTLLNLISGLDIPSEGRIFLSGKAISEMSGNELSDFRRDHIGLIFQSFNLIPVLTAAENIEYIMLLQGVSKKERQKRVSLILNEVGLKGKGDRFPAQLSGGQQQRVAIARAIVGNPDIILADEPTANLDSATGCALINMMKDLNERRGMTFVFSTHDNMIMERAKRLIVLRDGEISADDTMV
ncbi:MAG: ABC transporter ATP-binding protein [Thermodesulfobacteriota bacterium]|nr:ABC transporter ATP-binding protein [Thermodesulfobacteriota bacterium]